MKQTLAVSVVSPGRHMTELLNASSDGLFYLRAVRALRLWLDDRTVQCEHINREFWLHITEDLLLH